MIILQVGSLAYCLAHGQHRFNLSFLVGSGDQMGLPGN